MLIFMKDLHQTVRTGAISARTTLHTEARGRWSRFILPPLLFPRFPASLLPRLSSCTTAVASTAGSSLAQLCAVLLISLQHRMVKPHQGAAVAHQGTLVSHPGQLHLEAADEGLNAEAGINRALGGQSGPGEFMAALRHRDPPAVVRFLPDSTSRPGRINIRLLHCGESGNL